MHNPPHPGETIRQLCLEPLGLTVTEAAKALGATLNGLHIINNIRVYSKIANKAKALEKFHNEKSYGSTLYEARIAYDYFSSGICIDAIDESPEKKIKTPEFVVNYNGRNIFVECKSKKEFSDKESVALGLLSTRLNKIINDIKKSIVLNVYFGNNIEESRIDGIIASIIDKINSCEGGDFFCEKNNMRFNYFEIAKWGQEIDPYEIMLDDMPKNSFSHVRARTLDNGDIKLSNSIHLNFFPFLLQDMSKKIIEGIKSAIKQLPSEYPGLVYVELPDVRGDEFYEIIEKSYKEVFNYLKNNTTRIYAVILSSKLSFHDGSSRNEMFHFLIPNISCDKTMPKDFQIPFFINANLSEISVKSCCFFKFNGDIELCPYDVKYLQNYIDYSTRNQLIVAIDYKKQFYFNIFHSGNVFLFHSTIPYDVNNGENTLKFYYTDDQFNANLNENAIIDDNLNNILK